MSKEGKEDKDQQKSEQTERKSDSSALGKCCYNCIHLDACDILYATTAMAMEQDTMSFYCCDFKNVGKAFIIRGDLKD